MNVKIWTVITIMKHYSATLVGKDENAACFERVSKLFAIWFKQEFIQIK